MGEINDISAFAVCDDGTILRYANERLEKMNQEILEVIKVGSYSHRILASYDAWKIACKVCKSQYKQKNYKDYVEMLMRRNCPIEYEKTLIGRKYKCWSCLLACMPWYFFIFIPFMVSLKKKHRALLSEKKYNVDKKID